MAKRKSDKSACDFKLDPAAEILWVKGREVPLGPNETLLLMVLIESRQLGQRLKKQEIAKKVWGTGKHDNSLYGAKRTLRKAMGEPSLGTYISRSPYRLLVNVKVVASVVPARPDTDAAPKLPKQTDPVATEYRDHLLDQRLTQKLLQIYYPDADLRTQNLFRYSYSINGKEMTTNIVTSSSWLGLATAIDERSWRRFPLTERHAARQAISAVERERLIDRLRNRGIRFRNEPIYCLESLNPQDPTTIASFSVAQYIDYKLKLGGLEEELILCAAGFDFSLGRASSILHSRMPLRKQLLPDCRTLATYGGRLCAGGTNILLALRKPDHDGFVFFVKRRSGNVSTGRSLFSLLPSGMHQPTNRANAREETSVAATAYRETYEELFGGKEAEGEDKHVKPLWFMAKPPLKWLTLHRQQVTTEMVSFGLNLIDGTYEFQMLIVVNDERYWDAFEMTTNEEFADTETEPYSTLETERLASVMTDPRCADTSLIAMVEGLRRLQKLWPSRVKLPIIQTNEGCVEQQDN